MKAEEVLRARKLRITKGRVMVLSLLLKARRPLSQKEVMERTGGALDRVSVYRILHVLSGADIIHRAYVEGRSWVFESAHRCGEHHCHPHFSCRNCGATTCLEDIEIFLKGNIKKGFLVERQKVLIEGLCPECR
jgi:Fur family ferric uptake transcriptional regulator